MTRLHLLWLTVAILLALGSSLGGDTSIICGWLFLGWTPPFGAIWWFELYDIFLPLGRPAYVGAIGQVVVIALSYCFWFLLVPALVRRSRSKRIDAASSG
jgi:hypothetical protein